MESEQGRVVLFQPGLRSREVLLKPVLILNICFSIFTCKPQSSYSKGRKNVTYRTWDLACSCWGPLKLKHWICKPKHLPTVLFIMLILHDFLTIRCVYSETFGFFFFKILTLFSQLLRLLCWNYSGQVLGKVECTSILRVWEAFSVLKQGSQVFQLGIGLPCQQLGCKDGRHRVEGRTWAAAFSATSATLICSLLGRPKSKELRNSSAPSSSVCSHVHGALCPWSF